MAHEWYAGVRQDGRGSTWHALEGAVAMAGAAELIDAAEACGAWPISVAKTPLYARDHEGGLAIHGHWGTVARYRQPYPSRTLGVVGDVWRDMSAGWRDLVVAAVDSGARPLMGFALTDCHGTPSRVLATFDVSTETGTGTASGDHIKTHLLLTDGYDGKTKLSCGFTSVDVVCANTLAVSVGQDGSGAAKIRHTGTGPGRIAALQAGIADAIASGQSVRDTYARACDTMVSHDTAQAVFDALFPRAPESSSDTAKTRAENVRVEAQQACALPINRRDNALGCLATLWNTATWLVDRELHGAPRKVRGKGDPMASMVLGSRGKRVEEIRYVIETIMQNGEVQAMPASELVGRVDDLGARVLADMLD